MALDLASLQKAARSLENAVAVLRKKQEEPGVPVMEIEVVRAGVIQSFEFTYELSWKFMKRWLEENYGPVYVDGVPRRELFRLAAENLLLTDVDRWMDYHRARNRTSYIYDQAVAETVLVEAMAFLPAAQDLLQRLAERNA